MKGHGRKQPLAVMALAMGLGLGTGSVAGWSEETTGRSSRSGRTQASGIEGSKLEKKLNEVLANQQQILTTQQAILQKFDAMMEELRIIKVRTTLRQSGS